MRHYRFPLRPPPLPPPVEREVRPVAPLRLIEEEFPEIAAAIQGLREQLTPLRGDEGAAEGALVDQAVAAYAYCLLMSRLAAGSREGPGQEPSGKLLGRMIRLNRLVVRNLSALRAYLRFEPAGGGPDAGYPL